VSFTDKQRGVVSITTNPNSKGSYNSFQSESSNGSIIPILKTKTEAKSAMKTEQSPHLSHSDAEFPVRERDHINPPFTHPQSF
jgi:hypothetical protein